MSKRQSLSEFEVGDWVTLGIVAGCVGLFTLAAAGAIVQMFNIGIVFTLVVLAPLSVSLPLVVGAVWGSRRWSRWGSVGPAAERRSQD